MKYYKLNYQKASSSGLLVLCRVPRRGQVEYYSSHHKCWLSSCYGSVYERISRRYLEKVSEEEINKLIFLKELIN